MPVDAGYEAALALHAPADNARRRGAIHRLQQLARNLNRHVGRYGVSVGYAGNTKTLAFANLLPSDADLADLFVETGEYDVALARIERASGCLRVTHLVLHPTPSTPQYVRSHMGMPLVWHWRGPAICGSAILLVWPKLLRLRLLGFEHVFGMLKGKDGLDNVANLINMPQVRTFVRVLVSLTMATTDAPEEAAPDAKLRLGHLLVDATHTLGEMMCIEFMDRSAVWDFNMEWFVIRALCKYGWERVGDAFSNMLECCAVRHDYIPELVLFALKVVGLELPKWLDKAEVPEWLDGVMVIKEQDRFYEFTTLLYNRCCQIVGFLKLNSMMDAATRTNLVTMLFKFAPLVLKPSTHLYECTTRQTLWFSTKLPPSIAFVVSQYNVPTVYQAIATTFHDTPFSLVNIVSPAILQLDTFPESLDELIDPAITWLHEAGSLASAHGLASFIQILLKTGYLHKMDALWSTVAIVIPAILQVLTTTTQPLDATTVAVFDAAVSLNLDHLVMSLTENSDDLDLLCLQILGRDTHEEPTIHVDIQRRLVDHAVAYLNRNPQHPQTLPYGMVHSLSRRCDCPDLAWVLAPLVFSLPNSYEKRVFAHKCIDLLTRALDDDPDNRHWRQAVAQLQNAVRS